MASSSAERLLLDTSAAVALVVRAHLAHEAIVERVQGRRLGLAGHAAFETYSVLTRQPPPLRLSPAAASAVIAHDFPAGHHLSPDGAQRLQETLADERILGGAVFDALVGAAASEAGVLLITRDRRAVDVYRALDTPFELI